MADKIDAAFSSRGFLEYRLHVRAVAQSCPTLCDPVDCSPQAPLSLNFPGKNTGVGCHLFLQGIVPIWGLKPRLFVSSIGRQVLYH